MDKRNGGAGLLVAMMVAAAAALAAYKKRPIKNPDTTGTWEPVESQRTHRK